MLNKTIKMKVKQLIIISLMGLITSACASVKEYQKSKINDAEMILSSRKSEKFEQSFYLYREGPAGANGGKSGGGCGCN
jgi:hypothetical protein